VLIRIAQDFEKVLYYTLLQMTVESLIYPQYHPLKLEMYHTFKRYKEKVEPNRLSELIQNPQLSIDWETYEKIDSIFSSHK
jgi:hypothetical protein